MATATSKGHPLLLAAAVAHGVLALGHTTKGLDQFKHPSLSTLPTALRGAVKAGWYEGSGFFLIMGILNYKWSQFGIFDIYDKSIAGILISLLAAAGAAYYKSGDKPTATTLALVAILQGLGVRNGSYSRLLK
ncbi:Nn.00g110590.m01.CDS01 [Neocucurbitaria sp. VM-36]